MPRVSDFQILYKAEQPTLSVRTRTAVENLPALIGIAYGKIAAYLREAGMAPSEVPFVAYHNMDMKNLDVEMGFPIAKALPGNAEVLPGRIAQGERAFCLYRGAYTDIEPTYEEFWAWLVTNGYTPSETVYEHYFNGPNFPPDEYLTMIVMPVTKKA